MCHKAWADGKSREFSTDTPGQQHQISPLDAELPLAPNELTKTMPSNTDQKDLLQYSEFFLCDQTTRTGQRFLNQSLNP